MTEKTTELATEVRTEHTTEKTTELTTELATEMTTEKTTEVIKEKTRELTTEKTTEYITEIPIKQTELMTSSEDLITTTAPYENENKIPSYTTLTSLSSIALTFQVLVNFDD